MNLKRMISEKMIGVNQDRDRNWVLLLITIFTITINILLYFIHDKKLEDLKSI